MSKPLCLALLVHKINWIIKNHYSAELMLIFCVYSDFVLNYSEINNKFVKRNLILRCGSGGVNKAFSPSWINDK